MEEGWAGGMEHSKLRPGLASVLSVSSGFHKRRSLSFGGLPFFYLTWAMAKQLFGLLVAWGVRLQSGEGVGEGVGLVIRRSPDRFPAVPNDIVSLGKALHSTCLTYCKSLWIRASAK